MRFALFDTETTGLPKSRTLALDKQPRICELGVLVFDTDAMAVVEEYSQLINPGIPMPEDVIKIHGITDEMVQYAPSFKQVWFGEDGLAPAWRFFGATMNYMVAHNLPFDEQLLRFDLERCMGGANFELPAGICTVQEYTHAFGKRPKLTELYAWATGKTYEHKHRAIDDTRTLLEALLAKDFFTAFKTPQPIGENHYEVAERLAAENSKETS